MYTFLDGGLNTTFCSDQLLKELGVRGINTTLTLATLEREDSTAPLMMCDKFNSQLPIFPGALHL